MSGRTRARGAGFSLVELLVAALVAGVVLSAAYGWLWSVGSLAREQDDRAQAGTIAGVAARTLAADVRASLSVVSAAPTHDTSRSLVLVHDHPAVARETVTVVWDPTRGVLWRNASGTYIADHITGFTVSYWLDDGGSAVGAALSAADWRRVRAIDFSLVATVGGASATRHVRARVGS